MSRLLIATHNPGKFEEFKKFLATHVSDLVSLADLRMDEVPEENGETFAENSLLKANFYWQKSSMPTIADDGGFEVDALGGQPGVHSHRIDGVERSDEELLDLIRERVVGIPEAQRSARLTTVITLRVAQDKNFQAQASIEGVIRNNTLPPQSGLPYRTILWIPSYNKFYSEFNNAELQQASQRRRALEQLLPYITQYV